MAHIKGDNDAVLRGEEVAGVIRKFEESWDGKNMVKLYSVVAILKSGVTVTMKSTIEEGTAIDYLQANFKEAKDGSFSPKN